ncbi:hypothetical protein Nepgr_002101 [Nepenthes gracilis]|uniref:Uncharacterized protein n=1 Tax=Nepenthes gracilis TaxID=150966 RepID=A0AAD3P9K1_NEPGR|nr:hypothetical protein Nepgr_002101 [Nepenthes gracilis]
MTPRDELKHFNGMPGTHELVPSGVNNTAGCEIQPACFAFLRATVLVIEFCLNLLWQSHAVPHFPSVGGPASTSIYKYESNPSSLHASIFESEKRNLRAVKDFFKSISYTPKPSINGED